MQLDPIGVLLSKSWQRYQERFAVIVPIFLFPLVIIGIAELLFAQQTLPALALGGVLNLVGGIISLVSSLALVAAIGKNEDLATSYQTGFKLFWASLWVTILSTLAYFGGFVLLIIPGIIIGVQLALVQYVLVLEDKRGLSALTQSREYIKGFWWAYVGRTFLLGLIFGAFMLVIYLPARLLLGNIEAAVIYGLLLMVITPFSVTYTYEIFDNLKRLKPDAAVAAAKAETSFLKVCMVFGVVGIVGFILAFFALFAFVSTLGENGTHLNSDTYGNEYPPVVASSTY